MRFSMHCSHKKVYDKGPRKLFLKRAILLNFSWEAAQSANEHLQRQIQEIQVDGVLGAQAGHGAARKAALWGHFQASGKAFLTQP
jgi:hypothetical protein